MVRFAYVLLALLCWGTQAFALEGVKGTDDRIVVPAGEAPWSAVGRIDYPDTSLCTGTLVGPRLVLTAAHCLWDEKRHVWWKPEDMTFMAGLTGGKTVSRSGVEAVHRNPEFDPELQNSGTLRIRDWGFLVLKEDIGWQAGFIGIGDVPSEEVAPGKRLVQVGYSEDNYKAPTAHIGCVVKEVGDNGLIYHDCDAGSGDSGSPVFIWRKGSFFIFGVHASTSFRKDGSKLGKAVPAAAFIAKARELGASPVSYVGRKSAPPTVTAKLLLPRLGFSPDALLTFERSRGMKPTGVASPEVIGAIISELK